MGTLWPGKTGPPCIRFRTKRVHARRNADVIFIRGLDPGTYIPTSQSSSEIPKFSDRTVKWLPRSPPPAGWQAATTFLVDQWARSTGRAGVSGWVGAALKKNLEGPPRPAQRRQGDPRTGPIGLHGCLHRSSRPAAVADSGRAFAKTAIKKLFTLSQTS